MGCFFCIFVIMKRGRPLKYKDSEELESAIEKYFLTDPDKPTVTGLAHFLGFESRQSLYDYEERPNFSYTIKRAVLFIEAKHESMLYTNSPTGSIFWLKNRGWKDKGEHDVNIKGSVLNYTQEERDNRINELIRKSKGI